MKALFCPSLSSVTRWLLVVFGCAVLETAQPMIAAENPTTADSLSGDRILYPQGTNPSASDNAPHSKSGGNYWMPLIALALAGTGAWLVWKKKGIPLGQTTVKKIRIDETRSIGGRQYLVIANVENQRLLLGVSSGRIELLTRLDSDKSAS